MLCPICDCHACLHNDLPDEEFQRLLNAKIKIDTMARLSREFRIEPSYIWAPYVPIYPKIEFKSSSQMKNILKKYSAPIKKVDYISEFKWELTYDVPKKTIPKYSLDDLQKLFTALGITNIDLGDLTEEEIDEYIKQIKDQYQETVVGSSSVTRSTDTTAPPVTMAPTQEELRTQRKRDGLCLDCGDRGEFINGACVCRNGHGKIFG